MNKFLILLLTGGLLSAGSPPPLPKVDILPQKMGRLYIDFPLDLGVLNKNDYDSYSDFLGINLSYRFYPILPKGKKSVEYGFNILIKEESLGNEPYTKSYFEGRVGLLHYFAPQNKNSNYISLGCGLSTYRFYFIYTGIGREFDRDCLISKKMELNFSTTPIPPGLSLYGIPIQPAFAGNNVKLSVGIGF